MNICDNDGRVLVGSRSSAANEALGYWLNPEAPPRVFRRANMEVRAGHLWLYGNLIARLTPVGALVSFAGHPTPLTRDRINAALRILGAPFVVSISHGRPLLMREATIRRSSRPLAYLLADAWVELQRPPAPGALADWNYRSAPPDVPALPSSLPREAPRSRNRNQLHSVSDRVTQNNTTHDTVNERPRVRIDFETAFSSSDEYDTSTL